MIKCTHCGCQLTSRLTVWVHVHSGSHQCDGGMDIGVPIMDARGRIVYQDAPADLSSVAREAAHELERQLPGGSYADGWADCASRLPSEEELVEALKPIIIEHHGADENDQWWVSDHASDYARAVLSLIGEKISG